MDLLTPSMHASLILSIIIPQNDFCHALPVLSGLRNYQHWSLLSELLMPLEYCDSDAITISVASSGAKFIHLFLFWSELHPNTIQIQLSSPLTCHFSYLRFFYI